MVRWTTVVLVALAAAAGGPFERVPGGDVVYADLRVLAGAGLTDRSAVGADGELTRFECALLWRSALDALAARAADGRPRTEPDPTLTPVIRAMQRLFGALGPEIARLGLDREQLDRVLALAPRRDPPARPAVTPVLPGAPAPTFGSPVTALGALPGDVRSTGGPVELAGNRTTSPWDPGLYREALGARVAGGRLGPASVGLGYSQIKLLDAGEGRTLLDGFVLAADLRLALGDNSVVLEYFRSVENRFGGLFESTAGDAFKASFERRLGERFGFNLGFERLSSDFSPFADIFPGLETPDMYGVEAGFSWTGSRFGLSSTGAVYRPEGDPNGYANRLQAEMDYRFSGGWRLELGFQAASRKRLQQFDDLLTRTVTGRLTYGAGSWLSAGLSYRFDTTEAGSGPESDAHMVGASLGLGF